MRAGGAVLLCAKLGPLLLALSFGSVDCRLDDGAADTASDLDALAFGVGAVLYDDADAVGFFALLDFGGVAGDCGREEG